MNTMKTLMLAGFTALSLGMGTAMAQEGGSTDPVGPDYWAPSSIATRDAQAGAGQVQSGSSDVQTRSTTPGNKPFWTPGVAY